MVLGVPVGTKRNVVHLDVRKESGRVLYLNTVGGRAGWNRETWFLLVRKAGTSG